MALLTRDASPHDVLVIELDRPDRDRALRRLMATRAPGDRMDVPARLQTLEMAQEARRLGDLDVRADDDLRMAARAPQLPASTRGLEVGLVIEDNAAFERHLALEEPAL